MTIDVCAFKDKWPQHDWTVRGDAVFCETDPSFMPSEAEIQTAISEFELKKGWQNVDEKQSSAIGSVSWRRERYVSQIALGVTTTESEAKYAEILQYMQDVRDCDEDGGYATPDDALAALDALTKP